MVTTSYLRAAVIVGNLDSRFNLGLGAALKLRACAVWRVSGFLCAKPSTKFDERVKNSREPAAVNQFLKPAGLEVVVNGGPCSIKILPAQVQQEASASMEISMDRRRLREVVLAHDYAFLEGDSKDIKPQNINPWEFRDFQFPLKVYDLQGFVPGSSILKALDKAVSTFGVCSALADLAQEGLVNVVFHPQEGTIDPEISAAIIKGASQFLFDPQKGFVAGNISVRRFISAIFPCLSRGNHEKLIGKSLLERGGWENTLPGIVSFLSLLGIQVEGADQVRKLAQADLPAENYFDDELIRSALQEGAPKFLGVPEKGFFTGNIRLHAFLRARFSCEVCG